MSFDQQADNRMTIRPLLIFFILLLVGLASGCSRGSTFPQHRQMAALPGERTCRVAVLPFVNESDYLLADALFGKVFVAQLRRSGDHLVSQDGDIFRIYRQLRMLPGQSPNLEQYQIIADWLNVDMLITGTVLVMREARGDHGSVNPVIVTETEIRDGRSGEVLWTVFHSRQGTDYTKTMHFGTIHTVTGLSRQMAEEIINLWFEKGLSQCTASF